MVWGSVDGTRASNRARTDTAASNHPWYRAPARPSRAGRSVAANCHWQFGPPHPASRGGDLESCCARCGRRLSRPVSRVLYARRRDSHSSRSGVAARLQRPTRERRGPRQSSPIRSCFRWGLPCRAALAPHAVRSCRTLSPLPRTPCGAVRRSALCCTFRRLTPPRRYLAPCPLKPGLSSTCKHGATVRPTPHQNTGD